MFGTLDAVHGLYYLGMHGLFELVGYTPFTLRVPSALAVGVTAGLVVVLGRQLHSTTLGILAGTVFAVLPRVTWMGGEGRSFALSALLAVLMTVLFVRAQRGNTWGAWALYSASVLLGLVGFLYLALVVLAHGVAVLLHRARALRWLAAAGVAGLAALPFALVVVSQSSQLPDMNPLGVGAVGDVLVTQWFESSPVLAVAALALATWGLAGWAHPLARRVLLPAVVVPTLALLAVGLANPETYQPRYLGMCAPFVALAIALGMTRLRPRPVAALALAVVVALSIPALVAQRQPDSKKDAVWAQVAALVEQKRATDGAATATAIVYGALSPHRGTTARVISVAYPDAFAGTVDVTLDVPAADTGMLWATDLPLDESFDRLMSVDVLYVVMTGGEKRRAETAAALATVDWMQQDLTTVGDVHLLRFERAG